GATVVFLFGLGNVLEGYTMDRARGAIRSLMELAPVEARVRRGGREATVTAESVAVGEVVLVRPGERVPVDGRVVLGASAVNQAPITGESVPVEKSPDDEVFAGSIVEGGYLEVEATRPYAENTISRIARLVEEAQARRAPAQRFVERFSHYYTPTVLAGAVGVALLPWLVLGQPFDPWFYRALVLLVIACPCALVISTPVAIVSAIARAARLGILIKGGAYLEEAGRLRAVAFDKTGTLTVGRPEVTEVIPLDSLAADEVLGLAAAIEARSEHPLAAAVVRRAAVAPGNGRVHAVSEFEALVGRGVRARVDGRTYYVGSPRLFADLGVPIANAEPQIEQLQSDGQSVLLLGTETSLLGAIGLADRVRPGAREAVDALKRAGVARVALLTGDNEATARAIARVVGADEYRAGLLPEDKVKAVADLRARHGAVAMVGDGVNDAPALAAANVGVAMGAAGTDVALETADIALMADDLGKVAVAVDLSRRALGIIRANIAFALLIKAVFLALTAAGLATLWMAILADTGASLLVTLNGMRLLRKSGDYDRGGSADHPTDPMAIEHAQTGEHVH
ncbi:MAG: heavy metal translocating P-type ATPase, partial [Chloroflexota bacterium]